MNFLIVNTINRVKIEIDILISIILLFIFRAAIPSFKYPFLFLYLGFIIYLFIYHKNNLFKKILWTIKKYILVTTLFVIFLISFLLSDKIYLSIFKDVVNWFVIYTVLIMLTIISSQKDFLIKYFISRTIRFIFLSSIFIFVINLFDFFEINFYYFLSDKSYSLITSNNSLQVDYNFALIPILFGFISILYYLKEFVSLRETIFYNLVLLLFSFNIFLSSSRRGIFLLLILIIILIFIKIIKVYRKNLIFEKIGNNTNYFFSSLFILIILGYFFIFHTSFSFKDRTLKFMGSNNLLIVKDKIATNTYRSFLFFNKQISLFEYYNKIWSSNCANEPDTWQRIKIHKTIFPLEGKNVEIVPKKAKGYLMDYTCDPIYYTELDLCESYTPIVSLNINKGDKYKSSVFCYVSPEFDASSVSIRVAYGAIENNTVFGNCTSFYPLDKRGVWKKLEIEFNCNDGNIYIYMSITKQGMKDFSKLKGYVIFAYPQYEKIYSMTNLEVSQRISKKKIFSYKNLAIDTYNMNRMKVKRIKTDSLYKLPSNKFITLSSTPFFNLITLLKIQKDQDPIRNWVAKFISEDTTYHGCKANLIVKAVNNDFGVDRIVRWQFAWQIYTKEYNYRQKIFGGGFNFLNWYGYYFLKDKTKSDYPHNPFLYILLYSGIIGLFLYIYLLYKVFYYYFKYVKEYYLFFIFFLITYFFTFFGGGDPFNPPIMGFFMMLPFFINYIHQKDKSDSKVNELASIQENK